MRILLLTASYHPVLGTLQTAARALARQFIAVGHAAQAIANRYPRTLPAVETINGVSAARGASSRAPLPRSHERGFGVSDAVRRRTVGDGNRCGKNLGDTTFSDRLPGTFQKREEQKCHR
jgi:hypothetical protein